MSIVMTGLPVKLCRLLDDHLRSEEQRRRAVSLLAGGAAFEAWLAFELRLLAELHRNDLGLAEKIETRGGSTPRYWIVNEHRKVDVCILDGGEPTADPVLTFELKLVHNNKNWKAKCDEVREDLFPSGKVKSAVRPRMGRYALVGLVGLVYDHPAAAGYPGQIEDLARWKKDLANALPPCELWRSGEMPVDDPWIGKGSGAHFQLLLLGASASAS